MAHFEIDISEFDQFSKTVLAAALTYAREHREIKTHTLPLKEFYSLAGLGNEFYYENFKGIAIEVMKALVCSPDYDEGTLGCWPAFNSMLVTKTGIKFSVNPIALDAMEFPLRRDQVKAIIEMEKTKPLITTLKD